MACEEEEKKEWGEVLMCGSTGWDSVGRSRSLEGFSLLPSPARLRPLVGVPITFVASGSASCHCIALDVDGRCYTWGRNEKGQLGHGDFGTRDLPMIVASLAKYKVVKAGAGKNHSVIITDEGDSLAFGCNKHGQLGSGSLKNEAESLPVKCSVTKATHVACGSDFTVWLSSVPGATILSAGLPQYGQLGHGSDNQYNARDSSVKIVFEPQPRPKAIATLTEKTIVKVACGNNHTVAVDSNGFVYTWGFGGFGRLGHREQKDEFSPRVIEHFQRQNVLPPTAVIAAGSAYSACTGVGGQLYMWGRVKATGDSWMYPKPVYDMSGWTLHCIDCGEKTTFVGAETSCISWGQALYGELGYGPTGPKSSANPKKVDTLEGMNVLSVACGVGHSLIVVKTEGFEDQIEKLEVFEGNPLPEVKNSLMQKEGAAEDSDGDALEKGAENGEKKRRGRPKKAAEAPAKKKARGRPSKKDIKKTDDSDDGDSDNDDDAVEDDDADSDASDGSEEEPSRTGGKGSRGRGHGRGRGSVSSAKKGGAKPTEKKGSTRGRGRPRKNS